MQPCRTSSGGIHTSLEVCIRVGTTHHWDSAYHRFHNLGMERSESPDGSTRAFPGAANHWSYISAPLRCRDEFLFPHQLYVTLIWRTFDSGHSHSLVFPLTFSAVYAPDPVQVGLKGLGYGISVTAGAAIINWALSIFKNHNRELMIACCIVMSESRHPIKYKGNWLRKE